MATARPRIDYDALVKEDRVHGSAYTDPDIFAEELEKIFYRGWVYIGHANEIPQPGDYRLKKIGDKMRVPGFGLIILTTPEFDFSTGSITPLAFESPAQLVKALDEGAAKVRAALEATPDSAWKENWKLSFQGKTIFEGQRFLAYREMFLNHLVHHRAQLGVYLRLNEKPVPATYGPSADDKMGF